MRHLKAHRKLGRDTEHRISLLRNLATSLINSREDRIVTTLPKAKELRPFIEKAITLSRKAASLEGNGSEIRGVHLRRQAAAYFHAGNFRRAEATRRGQTPPPRSAGVAAVRRLFDELGERYKDRPGGYTRIIKMGRRAGDGAELAIIELVDNTRDQSVQTRKRVAAGSKKKKATDTRAAETAAEEKAVEGEE
jgi:large subunit ribosomal protein L17